MEQKPRVFIGSSTEGLGLAEALFACLHRHAEPTLWTHELFRPGRYPLEELERQLQRHAFAILVASPDDEIFKRGTVSPTVRDNLLVEFGLFTGALGRRRTFFVCPNVPRIELPSDLLGIVHATYDAERASKGADNRAAAVQVACQQIRDVIAEEWAGMQQRAADATEALRTSEKGQAIERLHSVAVQLRDALMAVQRDSFAAVSDERAFRKAKEGAAQRVQAIAASFAEDAKTVAVERQLKVLAETTAAALVDLPFPRELVVDPRRAERQALDIGLGALDSLLKGGDPMRHVHEAASNEAQAVVSSLKQRYSEWWERHSSTLQAAAVDIQDALFRAALDLGAAGRGSETTAA